MPGAPDGVEPRTGSNSRFGLRPRCVLAAFDNRCQDAFGHADFLMAHSEDFDPRFVCVACQRIDRRLSRAA